MPTPREPALTLSGRRATRWPRPAGPAPPLPGEPAPTARGVRRPGRAAAGDFLAALPLRESPSCARLGDSGPLPERAERVRARARLASLAPLPLPRLHYNLAGSGAAPAESEGGELRGGNPGVVRTGAGAKSRALAFPLRVALPPPPAPPAPSPARGLCGSLPGLRRGGGAPRVPSPSGWRRAAGGMWRLVPPKLGRLSRSLKLAALGSLLVLMVLHSPSLLASWQRNELADRRFLQLNKCPACFGTSWCRRFLNGQVAFEAWGRLRLLDFLNVKNVYFAQYGEPREGGRRRVVLKRLGSQRELAQLDQSICKRATGRPRCDLLQAMPRTEFARLNGDVRLLTPEAVEGWSDLVHCPSQRLLDRLVRRYAETKDSGSFLLRNLKDSERMQLLLTLAFNPEPLVLQVGAEPGRGACCRGRGTGGGSGGDPVGRGGAGLRARGGGSAPHPWDCRGRPGRRPFCLRILRRPRERVSDAPKMSLWRVFPAALPAFLLLSAGLPFHGAVGPRSLDLSRLFASVPLARLRPPFAPCLGGLTSAPSLFYSLAEVPGKSLGRLIGRQAGADKGR